MRTGTKTMITMGDLEMKTWEVGDKVRTREGHVLMVVQSDYKESGGLGGPRSYGYILVGHGGRSFRNTIFSTDGPKKIHAKTIERIGGVPE